MPKRKIMEQISSSTVAAAMAHAQRAIGEWVDASQKATDKEISAARAVVAVWTASSPTAQAWISIKKNGKQYRSLEGQPKADYETVLGWIKPKLKCPEAAVSKTIAVYWGRIMQTAYMDDIAEAEAKAEAADKAKAEAAAAIEKAKTPIGLALIASQQTGIDAGAKMKAALDAAAEKTAIEAKAKAAKLAADKAEADKAKAKADADAAAAKIKSAVSADARLRAEAEAAKAKAAKAEADKVAKAAKAEADKAETTKAEAEAKAETAKAEADKAKADAAEKALNLKRLQDAEADMAAHLTMKNKVGALIAEARSYGGMGKNELIVALQKAYDDFVAAAK